MARKYKDRKEYLRNYQRLWIAKRRTSFFKDKFCVKCKSKENLELDHIDPEIKESHRIFSWSKKRFDAEIKKCQVLCRDCHKEKTRIWNFNRRQHGRTLYGHGCRCKICYDSQVEHNARRIRK